MSASLSRFRIGAIGVLALVAVGCGFSGEDDGKPREAVSGRVMLDGEPLNGATIVFIKADSNHLDVAAGQINNGRFSISKADGPIQGLHQVRISRVVTGQVNPDAGPDEPSKSTRETIPAKYNSQTVLSAMIQHGPPNELMFQLDPE